MFFSNRRTLYRGFAHPGAEIHLRRVRREVHQACSRIVVAIARRQDHHRPMISANHLENPALYRDGPQGGGGIDVRRVEPPVLAAPLNRGNFVKATCRRLDNRMRIAQDEIFGRWPA